MVQCALLAKTIQYSKRGIFMKDHYLVPSDPHLSAIATNKKVNCNYNPLQKSFDDAQYFAWFDNLDSAKEYEELATRSYGLYGYHTPIYKMRLPENIKIQAWEEYDGYINRKLSITNKDYIISTLSAIICPYKEKTACNIQHNNSDNTPSLIMTLSALRSQDVAHNHAIDNFIDTIKISKCIPKIKNKMLSQTIEYLQEDITPEGYKALADTWSGHSNKNVAALGLLMVGIAAILLALSPVAVPITIGLGLAGLGIFAAANQEKGMAKAGRDILNSAARI